MSETLVAAPSGVTTYKAYRDDLRLVKTPKYPINGPDGRKVGETPGETIQFRAGLFELPAEGVVTLEDGRETDAASVREWLAKHKLNGDVYEGFVKVQEAVPTPTADEMKALTDAALAFDEKKLLAILAQEKAGWARETILTTAEDALEKMRLMKQQQAPEAPAKPAAKKTPAAE